MKHPCGVGFNLFEQNFQSGYYKDRSCVGLGDPIVTIVDFFFLPGRPRVITRASTNIILPQRMSPRLT